MGCNTRSLAVLVLALGPACGDSAQESPDGDTSSTDPETVGSSAEETGVDAETSSSADTSADTQDGVDSDTGDSSSTGEATGPATGDAALILRRWDRNGVSRFERLALGDGASAELVPLHPDDGFSWDGLVELADRRIVMESAASGQSRIWLGTLDHPEAADPVRLDVAPVLAGKAVDLEPVPGAEAITFISQGSLEAFRIDIADGVPATPVVIGRHVDSFARRLAADPTGSYAVFEYDAEDDTALDYVRTPLADPNPDDVDRLTDVAPGEAGEFVDFSDDGTGVLFVHGPSLGIGIGNLYYVDASGPIAEPPALVNPFLSTLEPGLAYCDRVAPVDAAVMYSLSDYDSGEQRWYHSRIVDGAPQEPVLVHDGHYGEGACSWATDGSWVAFFAGWITHGGGLAPQLVVVPLVDGVPGDAIETIAADTADGLLDVMAYRDDAIFVRRAAAVGAPRELWRVPLVDGVPSEPELMVPVGDGSPSTFDSSAAIVGDSLLYIGYVGDDRRAWVLDLETGALELVSADTPPGTSATAAVMSADERFVAYVESTGTRSGAVKVVDRERGGVPEVIASGYAELRFAKHW
jgi:hypothetical protein